MHVSNVNTFNISQLENYVRKYLDIWEWVAVAIKFIRYT